MSGERESAAAVLLDVRRWLRGSYVAMEFESVYARDSDAMFWLLIDAVNCGGGKFRVADALEMCGGDKKWLGRFLELLTKGKLIGYGIGQEIVMMPELQQVVLRVEVGRSLDAV